MIGGLDPARLAAALRRGGEGRLLEVREEVGSTQDLAFGMAAAGAPDGSLAVADRQARGRGRLGRGWDAPPGAGLLASFVLRPPAAPPPRPTLLVAATALAVAEAVEGAGADRPRIRWPNDVLAGGRKIAGVLLESRDWDAAAPLLVLGVGVNVGQGPEGFPPGIRGEATSLRIETGRAPDRTGLLVALVGALDRWRGRLAAGEVDAVEEAFRARAAHVGEAVTVLEGSEPVAGVLESVSPVAGLALRLPGGALRVLRPEHARGLRAGARERE